MDFNNMTLPEIYAEYEKAINRNDLAEARKLMRKFEERVKEREEMFNNPL